MQPDEFQNWVEHHTNCFPELKTFFENNSGAVGMWFQALRDCDLSAAKQASIDLLSRDERIFPSAHPGKVRALCFQKSEKRPFADDVTHDVFNEPRHECRFCLDLGVVSVFHPKAYGPIKESTYDRGKHLGSLSVACNGCEKGDRKADPNASWIERHNAKFQNLRVRAMKQFDPDLMCPLPKLECCPEGSSVIDWQEEHLIEFVQTRIQYAGFHNEFAAYG